MGVDDIRLQDAKQKPFDALVEQLGINGLKRVRHDLVGPCPVCGGGDRFSINLRKGVFYCRKCQITGDQIALIEAVKGLSFRAALDWICGPAEVISDAERAKRAKDHADAQAQKDAVAEEYRQREIARARDIWEDGCEPEGSPVRAYLTRRGIPPGLFALPVCLRFHRQLPYWHGDGKSSVVIHRGPAMLAAIQGPDNRFCGVHQTWIDLDQPKGKIMLPDPARPGSYLAAKKVKGTQKGGAIRLRARPLDGDAMVMAEGIETTISALVADTVGAAFWCGVNLGNMAGPMVHGKGLRYQGIPDMVDARAFVPPDWVRHLTYIMDGDSDPRMTRAKVVAGLRRAKMKIPGLRTDMVRVPDGMDLNDVLMRGLGEVMTDV